MNILNTNYLQLLALLHMLNSRIQNPCSIYQTWYIQKKVLCSDYNKECWIVGILCRQRHEMPSRYCYTHNEHQLPWDIQTQNKRILRTCRYHGKPKLLSLIFVHLIFDSNELCSIHDICTIDLEIYWSKFSIKLKT